MSSTATDVSHEGYAVEVMCVTDGITKTIEAVEYITDEAFAMKVIMMCHNADMTDLSEGYISDEVEKHLNLPAPRPMLTDSIGGYTISTYSKLHKFDSIDKSDQLSVLVKNDDINEKDHIKLQKENVGKSPYLVRMLITIGGGRKGFINRVVWEEDKSLVEIAKTAVMNETFFTLQENGLQKKEGNMVYLRNYGKQEAFGVEIGPVGITCKTSEVLAMRIIEFTDGKKTFSGLIATDHIKKTRLHAHHATYRGSNY